MTNAHRRLDDCITASWSSLQAKGKPAAATGKAVANLDKGKGTKGPATQPANASARYCNCFWLLFPIIVRSTNLDPIALHITDIFARTTSLFRSLLL